MKNNRVRMLFVIGLMVTDAAMIALAFLIAYAIRAEGAKFDPNIKVGAFSDYAGMLLVQVIAIVTVAFSSQSYHLVRAVAKIDEFYAVFGAASIGTMMSVAVSTLLFKTFEFDFPRVLIIYAWVLTILLVTLGRWLYRTVQVQLQMRGVGRDRALIVGTGDIGQLVLDKIKSSPYLGYEVVGFVSKNGNGEGPELLGRPVLGRSDDLPQLIDQYQIDEVIIALPEAAPTGFDSISKVRQGRPQHQGLPRCVSDHRQSGVHRRSGRPATAQYPRCAAARLARHRQAADGPHRLRDWVGVALAVYVPAGDPDQTGIARPGVLRAGTHGSGCQAVSHAQIPIHAAGRRGQRPRLSKTIRAARGWAPFCAS